jgi:putative FmdB family regulatory protein
MPTYEYLCEACEHNFDEFQSINDAPLKKCPKCGKRKLRRVFGAGAAIIFKGSGFYQTDYRSESYQKAAKADQESSKPAADTGGTGGKATESGSNGTAPAPGKAQKTAAKSSKSSPRSSDD